MVLSDKEYPHAGTAASAYGKKKCMPRRAAYGVGGQLPVAQQVELILPDVFWPELVRWSMEVLPEILQSVDVSFDGSLRILRRWSSSSIIFCKRSQGTSL